MHLTSSKNHRILIVEDNSAVSSRIEHKVQKFGHTVVGTARSGEEAIQKSHNLKPDLVLMDIVLDGAMDGIDATRKIQEQDDAVVVFLTGHTEEQYITRAMEIVPQGYLTKPFREKDLFITIEMAVASHNRVKKSVNHATNKPTQKKKDNRTFIPICACCKDIRDKEDIWLNFVEYFQMYTDIKFTHSICPSCSKLYYSNFSQD